MSKALIFGKRKQQDCCSRVTRTNGIEALSWLYLLAATFVFFLTVEMRQLLGLAAHLLRLLRRRLDAP
jgi:hypothetical protein